VNVLQLHESDLDAKDLQALVDPAKARIQFSVIVAAILIDGKVALVAGATSDLIPRVHAGHWAKAAAALVNGNGAVVPTWRRPLGLDQIPSLVQERLRQPSWRPSRGRASGDDDAHGLFRLLLRH
jgi:alanyl-tRNA synthetase